MTESNVRLPPAAEAVHRMLAELGPLPAVTLRERLRTVGFNQPIERLSQLSDRFPSHFRLTAEGLLSVASVEGPNTKDDLEDQLHEAGWFTPTTVSRVHPDRVAVLDLETTGLDPNKDYISEVALVRLDGQPIVQFEVQFPGSAEIRSKKPELALHVTEPPRV